MALAFFFDENVTERIAKLQPYAINTTHRTPLDEDGIYRGGGSAGGVPARPRAAPPGEPVSDRGARAEWHNL